jgi:hypothetical protein
LLLALLLRCMLRKSFSRRRRSSNAPLLRGERGGRKRATDALIAGLSPAQLIREARISDAHQMGRYTVQRRRAILVASVIDLETRLTDAALDGG